MSRKRSVMLTDHELRLMEVLWTFEKGTVADVTARVGMPPLAYNTVLTTLRTLEQKGYVDHEVDGRAFVYRPIIVRKEASYSALRYVLRRFFGDSPGKLALSLLDSRGLTDADLARVKKLLAVKRKEKQ